MSGDGSLVGVKEPVVDDCDPGHTYVLDLVNRVYPSSGIRIGLSRPGYEIEAHGGPMRHHGTLRPTETACGARQDEEGCPSQEVSTAPVSPSWGHRVIRSGHLIIHS